MTNIIAPIIDFFYDSANHSYHILEKQENTVELYEEQYDCQGEYLLFPTKNVTLLNSKIKEDHGESIDVEQDSIYLYTNKGEILEFNGLYRAYHILWDKTSPLLYQPFIQEVK